MAMVPTQFLTEMSARNIFWVVKAAGAWGWQPYHFNVLTVLKSGSLNLLHPSGPVQGLLCAAYFFFMWRCGPSRAMGSSFFEVPRSHKTKQPSQYNSSGRVISSSERLIPENIEHSQQKNFHDPAEFKPATSAASGRRPTPQTARPLAPAAMYILRRFLPIRYLASTRAVPKLRPLKH